VVPVRAGIDSPAAVDFSIVGACSAVAVAGAGLSSGDADKALSCTASINAAADASSRIDFLSVI